MNSSIKIWLHAGLWRWRHWRGRYLAEEAAAVSPYVGPGDICVDIGAHAGSWTKPLARMVPAGQVLAFEALPHNALALQRLMQLLLIPNVSVINAAVSDKAGTVEIAWRTKAGRKLTGNTHLATKDESGEVECVSVPAITLDAWGAQLPPTARVSFVKIDVEGAELLVLRGARGFLQKHRPVIFMEIVADCCARYGYTPADLFSLFRELGYQPHTVGFTESGSQLHPTDAKSYPGRGDVLLLPFVPPTPDTR